MENIYSIFRDKLLLLGEHGYIDSDEDEDTSSTSSYKDHGRKKSNVKYQHYHK